MINLLPPEGKKRVLKNYWLRVLSVYFMLTGFTFFIAAALLLPTYFYILFQGNAFNIPYTEEDATKLKQIEADIKSANNISELLVKTPKTVNDTEIIREILSFSNTSALINNITIRKENRKITSIVVSGETLNRNALVSFRDSAEAHRFFENVNLPLSNLAKDQDIPFSLTLEPSEVLLSDI